MVVPKPELRKGDRCNSSVRDWFDALGEDDVYLSVLVVGEIERGIERIPTVDGLLAATADVHGLILATRNATHIESLDIEWVNPFTVTSRNH